MNDNDGALKAWNTVVSDKFVRFKHLLIGGSASPAAEIIRRAGEEGERLKPQVVSAWRARFAHYEKPSAVGAPSSAWCITRRRLA